MILGRSIVAPLALLVAATTTSVILYGALADAPTRFFGSSGIVVIGPAGGTLPGHGEVDGRVEAPLRALPYVRTVSPEIFLLTTLQGRSSVVRGVEPVPFLDIEGAHLVDGRLPIGPHEALAGASFAKTFDAGVGAHVIVPSTFSRVAAAVDIVGVYDSTTPARDQLVIDLPTARTLTNLSAPNVHIVRVRTDDEAALRTLVDNSAPNFGYTGVRISATRVFLGEPVVITANLTNWGETAGTKIAQAFAGDRVVAQKAFRLGPRETAFVRLAFILSRPGVTSIHINPTFSVEVDAPDFQFVDLPPEVFVGAKVAFRVANASGAPAPHVNVSLAGEWNFTDEKGITEIGVPHVGTLGLTASIYGNVGAATTIRAVLPPVPASPPSSPATNATTPPAQQNPATNATNSTTPPPAKVPPTPTPPPPGSTSNPPPPTAPPPGSALPPDSATNTTSKLPPLPFRVVAMRQVSEVVSSTDPSDFEIDIANTGSAKAVNVSITLDGSVVNSTRLDLAAYGERTLPVSLLNVTPGDHELGVAGSEEKLEFVSYKGPNAYVEYLRDHVGGGSGKQDPLPEDYIKQVLGDVSHALFALSLASGVLATCGVLAVLSRHIAERSANLGVLKTLGASEKQVLAIVSGEAVRWAALATGIGLAVGVLVAKIIDATGLVRAFGFEVHASVSWPLLALLFFVSLDVVIVTARAVVRRLYRRDAQALVSGSAKRIGNSVSRSYGDAQK